MPLDERLFDARAFFREAIEKDRLASCYLFIGDDYLKKIEVSRFIARALNCETAIDDENCLCNTCIKIENFNHPDVVWIKPANGKRLKIESVRTIIRKIYLKPYEGKRKIFVVEDAEVLTEEAQNAFLKTLEEPPADAVIILMAQRREDLLETIISRCQIVKFFVSVSEEEIDLFVKNFLLGNKGLEYLGEFTKKIERQKLDRILGSLLVWFRDTLVCKAGKEELCLNKKDILKIKETARQYSYQKIENVIKGIIHLRSLIQHNVNPKIVTSNLALILEE
jgi:DNA polymerase-3 subunit delta'